MRHGIAAFELQPFVGQHSSRARGDGFDFADLRPPIGGVLDLDPRLLRNAGDRRGDALDVRSDRHRVAHVQPVQRGDRVVRPEPRIEPDGQLTSRAGATDTGDQLVDEPARTALGVR